MYIYVIINLINGKYYVGQTILNPPIRRWTHHLRVVRRKSRKNDMLITRAIRKYGVENFTFEIIKILQKGSTQEQLNKAECRAIKKYDSMVPNGYNVKEGGSHGKHSQETRKKMSIAQKGIPLSDGHRLALSIAQKGKPKRPFSKTHKLNISKAKKGIAIKKGRPCSQETRLKIGQSKKGVPRSKETRQKMSDTTKGIPRGPFSNAHKLAISKVHKGVSLSEAHCLAISKAKTGVPWSALRRERYNDKKLKSGG